MCLLYALDYSTACTCVCHFYGMAFSVACVCLQKRFFFELAGMRWELCTCLISNLVVGMQMSVCNVCLEDNQQFLISHGQATWHPIKGTSLCIRKQTLFCGVTQSARRCLYRIHNKQPNGFFTFLAGFFGVFSSIQLSKLVGLITTNPDVTSCGVCFFSKIK